MKSRKETTFTHIRLIVASVWMALCLLAAGAPFLAHLGQYAPSSAIYLVFSNVCHQMPERSFSLLGFPFAICHRCFGIYLGLVIGSLVPVAFSTPEKRRIWIAAASLPLLIDTALPFTGIGNNVPCSRLLTGLLFGIMLASFFVQGIMELARTARQRQSLCKGEI